MTTGSPDTLIGYFPAGRVTDLLVCGPAVDVIRQGSSNVLINGLEAARLGDPTTHGGTLVMGEPTVLIGETPQSLPLVGAAATGKPFCEECPILRQQREEQERALAEAEARSAREEVHDVDPPSEPEPNPYRTTPEEQAAAAAPGNEPAQRAAREKVVREFYWSREREGLGDERADQDLGTGGAPPRPNGHPKGFGIDLAGPVRVVPFPPPEQVSMFVRRTGPAQGLLGNFMDPFLPPESQTGDQLGLNDDPTLRKRVTLTLPPGGGVALETRNGPILDDWTDRDRPVATRGGGTQWTVANGVKEEASCAGCGSPPDLSVAPHRWPEVGSTRRPPRRCTCTGT